MCIHNKAVGCPGACRSHPPINYYGCGLEEHHHGLAARLHLGSERTITVYIGCLSLSSSGL